MPGTRLLSTATAELLGQVPIMHPSLPVSALVFSLFLGPSLAIHPPQSRRSEGSRMRTESCPALLQIWSKILEFTKPKRPTLLRLVSSLTFLQILHPTPNQARVQSGTMEDLSPSLRPPLKHFPAPSRPSHRLFSPHTPSPSWKSATTPSTTL